MSHANHIIFLAVGTNLGNREDNLEQALQALPPLVNIIRCSRLFETSPAYFFDQPTFLNIVIKGETALSPADLLSYLKQLEDQIGREKSIRFGPRKIDLDIIYYDDWVVDSGPDLQIPHPRMQERAFVLRPLVDIAPHFVHPVLKQTSSELLANLPADDGILKITDWQPQTPPNFIASAR